MKYSLQSNEWYSALVEEVKATLTEAVFNSRWSLIEGYHQVGKLLRENEKIPMTELLTKCAVDMDVSSRKLWYAVQFYDKYPELEKLPEGKNISWSKIKTQYLPENSKEVEKPKKQNQCRSCHKIIICSHCGE